MSILKETIIELKNMKEEATKLAKHELFVQHSKIIEEKAKKLFEEKLFGEQKELKEEDSEKENDSVTTTKDYFDDYLSDELGKNNNGTEEMGSGDIEITIDLGDDKDAVVKTDDKREDDVIVKDISEEEDIDSIMNEIMSLSENDEIEIKDENKNKETDTMENKIDVNKEMGKAKEMYENDVDSALEKLSEPAKEEESEMSIDEALQSLAEIENDLCDEKPSDETEKIQEESMEDETEGTMAIKEEDDSENELMEALLSLGDEEVDKMLATQEVGEEELEEGMSGSVSQYNAHKAGDSDTSYGKNALASINEKFKFLENKTKELIKENISLKESVKTLNETNGLYAEKLKTYSTKLYEAMVIAKKTACSNKLMLEHTLNEEEKINIIKSFDGVTSREQADKIYTSLNESFAKNEKTNTLNEIENKISNVKHSGSSKLTEHTVYNNPVIDRMKKLINGNRDK